MSIIKLNNMNNILHLFPLFSSTSTEERGGGDGEKAAPYPSSGISNFFIMPNHQLWYAKWRLSCNTCASHTRFCTFDADLRARSVLIGKISAPELSQKFIKRALLVGYAIYLSYFYCGRYIYIFCSGKEK